MHLSVHAGASWFVLSCARVCVGDWSVVTGVLGSDAAYSAQDAGARRSRRSVARASLQLYDIQYENVRALIQRQRVQLIQLQEARNEEAQYCELYGPDRDRSYGRRRCMSEAIWRGFS